VAAVAGQTPDAVTCDVPRLARLSCPSTSAFDYSLNCCGVASAIEGFTDRDSLGRIEQSIRQVKLLTMEISHVPT